VHMPGVDTVTTSMRGAFKSDSELRREFYTLIGK
jgi:GTP cyclohydrolase I